MMDDFFFFFFFGSSAMDIRLLLPECHGSEIILRLFQVFYRGRNEKRQIDGLGQSETILGKNEHLQQSAQDGRMVNVSESVSKVMRVVCLLTMVYR